MKLKNNFFVPLLAVTVFSVFTGKFVHAAKPLESLAAPTPCDPSRPNCHYNPPPCDPSRPNCHASPTPCDPSRPNCHGTSTPTPTATPCDPSRPNCGGPSPVTPAQIRSNATREANRVANRLIETYGRAESWNYNFVEGFRLGLNGDPSRPSSTQRGRDEGERLGQSGGNRAGADQGTQVATLDARQAVASRFRELLDQPGLEPNLSLEHPVPVYDPVTPAPVNNGLNDRSRELQSQFRSESDRWNWYTDGYSLNYSSSGHQLDIDRLLGSDYPSGYSFSDRDLNASAGFNGWLNQRFGGGYSHDLYDQLTSSQKDDYRSIFESVFEQQLRSRYESTRRSRQEAPFRLGVRLGSDWNDARSYAQGLNETYGPSYRRAAGSAFVAAYSSTYPEVFQATASVYMTRPVLEVSGIHVLSSNGFAPGTEVSVKIDRVANLGRVALNAKVALQSEVLQALGTSATLNLAPSTSKAAPVQFSRLAVVQSPVNGLDSNSAILSIGDSRYTVVFGIDWNAAMEYFSGVRASSAEFNTTSAWIIAQLNQEWSVAIRESGNRYRDGTSVLEKLVKWYESASGAKRANLRSLSKQIQNVQNTGGFHPSVRPAFKKLAARIN